MCGVTAHLSDMGFITAYEGVFLAHHRGTHHTNHYTCRILQDKLNTLPQKGNNSRTGSKVVLAPKGVDYFFHCVGVCEGKKLKLSLYLIKLHVIKTYCGVEI